MKNLLRLLAFLIAVAALSTPAAAQYTTVTAASGVQDSAGVIYNSGGYNITLNNPTGLVPYFQGSPLPQGLQQFRGVLTTAGALPSGVSIPSNAYVLAGPGGAASQMTWTFSICAQFNNGCFSDNISISGASQDVAATLNAVSPRITFTIPSGWPPGPANGCPQGTGSASLQWATSCGSGGSGNPCTTTALSLQYNSSGAFGCTAGLTWTSGTNTLNVGSTSTIALVTGANLTGLTTAMLPTGIPNANLAFSTITVNAPSFMTNWGTISLGGAWSPTWLSESPDTVLCNCTGSSAVPTFGSIVAAMLPVIFQTNSSNNTNGNTLNISSSTLNAVGLAVIPHNTGTNVETWEVTGNSYTGNSATATALAATPTLCSSGQAAQGVTANGNATGCFTPSGSGTINSATQYSATYYSGSGSSSTVSGSSPCSTVNTTYNIVYQVTGNAAVAPSCTLPGVPVDAQTGNYTLSCTTATATDRFGEVEFNITSAATLTVGQAGGNACTQGNYGFVVRNADSSTALLTVTATTSVFDPENVSSKYLLPGEGLFVYSDATTGTGNYHAIPIHVSAGSIVSETTNYTALASDSGNYIVFNCSAACAYTLPSTPFSNKSWKVHVMSIGSTLATISLNGLDFNGGSSAPALLKYEFQDIETDGSNYFGSAPLVAGTNITLTPASNGQTVAASGGTGTVGSCGTSDAIGIYTGSTTIGCGDADFTYVTHTLTGGSSAIVNLSALTPATGLEIPVAGGASPTTDGYVAVDSTSHRIAFGSNSATGLTAKFISSGTATLGTSAISSASCASAVTVSATGVLTTDTITFNFNADPSSTTGYAPATGGTLYIYAYPTSNDVNFKVCNNTGSSITPGAATLNWSVTR